jgi:multidrug resistance efflux pump
MPFSKSQASISIALIAAAACSYFSGCGKENSASATQPAQGQTVRPPIAVTATKARMIDMQRSVRVVGDLMPLESVTLSNRVTGTINQVNYDRGSEVPPFDPNNKKPMLTIEPKRYEMGLIQARQELNQVLAKLGRTERAVAGQVVNNANPVVNWSEVKVEETAPYKKAQSEFNNAEKKLKEAEPLHKQNLIHEFEFTDYINAYNVANSNRDVARNEAMALIAQAQGLEAVIQLRQKDFDDASIYPPGPEAPDADRTKITRWWVTSRMVGAGEYLKEGTPLFVLEADDPLRLRARVPEQYLTNITVGNKVVFEVANLPDVEFTGEVRTIDPSVNPENRTFVVEALVKNAIPQGVAVPPGVDPKHPLRSGQFVQGDVFTKINGKELETVLAVPFDSIVTYIGESKVYVAGKPDENGVQKVRQVPIITGQQTTVKDGNNSKVWVEVNFKKPDVKFEAGDLIIVDGVTRVSEGSSITTREPGPKMTQPASTNPAP